MAPPPVRILESALSLLEHRVLVALCEARVPDAIDTTTSVSALAETLSIDEARLDRLVRFAAARGWLTVDRRGRVKANKTTAFLRSDHPAGWRAWVDFVGGNHVIEAVGALALDGTGHGYQAVNGKPIFDWFDDHPHEWEIFDAAMAAGGRMHALMLDAAINWRGVTTICDVGGGTGDLLQSLLDRHPPLARHRDGPPQGHRSRRPAPPPMLTAVADRAGIRLVNHKRLGSGDDAFEFRINTRPPFN